MDPSAYANYVDLATTTDAKKGAHLTRPEIDGEGVHAALSQISVEIGTELQDEARREHAAAGGGRSAAALRATEPPPPAAERRGQTTTPPQEFDIGGNNTATDVGPESWGVVGAHISVSNTLWDASATGSSDATVAGYIGKHSFPSGPPSPHTYVILCDECHYAVRHSVVALSIVDSKLRRRISKQGNPKALA